MKINWGWGITAFYVAFVLFMLSLVWMASANKVEMVTTDYYKKELAYQAHIDKVRNSAQLKDALRWQVNGKTVTLTFPADAKGKAIDGNVLFYCPSNSAKDFSMRLNVNAKGECVLSSDKFSRGVYRMQVDWKADNNEYYSEGVININ